MVQEYRSRLIDLFRMTQLVFIILFLITRTMFYHLLWFDKFEYYSFSVIGMSAFLFFYFEIINNLCWITFLVHIDACKGPNDMNEDVIRKVLNIEKILLAVFTTFIVISVLPIIVIFLLALGHQCGN